MPKPDHNMTVEWAKILEWLSLKPSIYFSVLVASAALLFGPTAFVGALGLISFAESYRPWLGIAFLLSGALLVGSALAWVFTDPQSPVYEWWQIRRLKKALMDLSPPEKRVLRKFVDGDTSTHYFEIADGVVNNLVQKRILWRASNVAVRFDTFPYNMQPWAWKYLRRNSHVLD